MSIFGALSKAFSSPVMSGITQGLVQDQRRAFAQNQFDQAQGREQAERDFASEFNKRISTGDVGGATALFDQFSGQLSPQTVSNARGELAQAKNTMQTEAQNTQNTRTMAQSMAQGATPAEGQFLAEAGRSGAGLDALMGVRKNVQGRQAQAQQAGTKGKVDIIKALAGAMSPGMGDKFVGANLPEGMKMPDMGQGGGGGQSNTDSGTPQNDTPPAPKISTSAQNKIADIQTVNDLGKELLESLNDPKIAEHFGPINGLIANARNMMGAGSLPPEVVSFRSRLYDMVDLWLRERTGAAVTADEVNSAMTEILGGTRTSPDALRSRLQRMIDDNGKRLERISQGTIKYDSGAMETGDASDIDAQLQAIDEELKRLEQQ